MLLLYRGLNMKRNLIILFCTFILTGSVFSAPKAKTQKYLYVAVEELGLKNKAGITAKQIDTLMYGSRVIVLDEKGSWCKIQLWNDNSVTGWVNSGSLTKKKIIVAQNASFNIDQLALAGKGNEGQLRPQIDVDEDEEDNGKRVTTNPSELALAGKGFNSAVEAAYEDEFEVSFELVDAIEQNGVSEDTTIAFIIQGNLRLED